MSKWRILVSSVCHTSMDRESDLCGSTIDTHLSGVINFYKVTSVDKKKKKLVMGPLLNIFHYSFWRLNISVSNYFQSLTSQPAYSQNHSWSCQGLWSGEGVCCPYVYLVPLRVPPSSLSLHDVSRTSSMLADSHGLYFYKLPHPATDQEICWRTNVFNIHNWILCFLLNKVHLYS